MKSVILFGTGEVSLQLSDWIEDDNISYYVDNNKDKVGKVFRGKEIISVCQLKEIYTEYEIVVAVGNDYIEEIGTQLDQLGIPYSCLWDFPFYYIQGKRHFVSTKTIIKNNQIQNYGKVCIWGDSFWARWLKASIEQEGVSVVQKNYADIEEMQQHLKQEEIDANILCIPNKDVHIGMNIAQDVRYKVLNLTDKTAIDCFDQDCYEEVFYNKNLEKYKGVGKGKRCFIIGNGPSLKAQDLQVLYENNEITFAANYIYKIFDKTEWRPTFYTCVDQLCLQQHADEISNVKCKIKFVLDYENLGMQLPYKLDAEFVHIIMMEYNENGFPKFSSDIERGIYVGYTVTYAFMQMACYMGFEELILLGVDHSNFNQHFTKEYVDKNDQVYVGNFGALANQAYIVAKQYSERHGIIIKNATRGGRLELFDRVCFDDLF